MRNNSFKKLVAFTLAAIMTIGGTATVFATSGPSATISGSGYNHVSREIIKMTYPTQDQVEDTFNYIVDPENLIGDSGLLLKSDKTTVSVSGNNDRVYFKKSVSGNDSVSGNNGYDSTSDPLEFVGRNSVDVDVKVTARLGDATSGNTDIEFVKDEAALKAATKPALLMELIVGSDDDNKKAITRDGVDVTDQIKGKSENFKYDVVNESYVYQEKTGDLTWNSTFIQLHGQVNDKEVTNTLTAPTIILVWGASKAGTTPSIATKEYTLQKDTAVVVNVNLGNATAVKAVNWGGDGNSYLNNGWTYDADAKTLTLDVATVNALINNTSLDHTYTVVFNDEANTSVKLTMK